MQPFAPRSASKTRPERHLHSMRTQKTSLGRSRRRPTSFPTWAAAPGVATGTPSSPQHPSPMRSQLREWCLSESPRCRIGPLSFRSRSLARRLATWSRAGDRLPRNPDTSSSAFAQTWPGIGQVGAHGLQHRPDERQIRPKSVTCGPIGPDWGHSAAGTDDSRCRRLQVRQ